MTERDPILGPATEALIAKFANRRDRELADLDAAYSREVWRAMMLAKDLDTCRALLRGESVPLERLDPEWVARFGLKSERAA